MPRPKNSKIHNERQQQILQATRLVFTQQGLADVRMEDIARASGLSKGTLYLYYKNKEDLIIGLLDAFLEDLLAHLRTLLDYNDLTIQARLMNHVDMMTHAMGEDTSILNIAYSFYAVAAYQPTVRQSLQVYFVEYRQILTELFTRGVKAGEFGQIDVSQSAITLIAMMEGVTLLWFADPDHIQLKHILPRMVQQFFDSLKPTTGSA